MTYAIVWEKIMYVVGISKLGSVFQVHVHVPGSHLSLGLQCLVWEEHISVD